MSEQTNYSNIVAADLIEIEIFFFFLVVVLLSTLMMMMMMMMSSSSLAIYIHLIKFNQ